LIPQSVKRVWRALLEAGCKTYLVGGSVRDYLMGREPHDYDFTTSCRPEKVEEVLRSAGFPVYETGIEFGTVMTVVDGFEVEVTTMRREQYRAERGRKPIVTFTEDLIEDLSRRDFTINAMAMDIEGHIIDPFGGMEDLRKGIIRFVGKPEDRIEEDPLRCLRALRFAAKLGFRIDEESFEALKTCWRKLSRVSWERIRDEILKAAETPMFHLFADLLHESLLDKYVMPEMEAMARVRHASDVPYHYGETVLEHTIDVLERLDRVGAPVQTKLCGLLHDVGKPRVAEGEVSKHFYRHEVVGAEISEKILRRWKMSSADIRRIVACVRWHMLPHQYANQGMSPEEMARRLFARLGAETAMDVLMIAYGDTGDTKFLDAVKEVQRLATLEERKPLVTGYDIMDRYKLPPGKWIGELKQALYELQLTENIQDKEQLFKVAEEKGIVRKILEKYGWWRSD